MKLTKNIGFLGICTSLLLSSCVKDLDVKPLDKTVISSGTVYDIPGAYYNVLGKCYGSFTLTGNQGPAGVGDVAGIDEGTSGFNRLLFYLQELTTDEAIVQQGWSDPGLQDLHPFVWSSDNVLVKGMYYRLYYIVNLTNELINHTSGKGALSSDVKENLPLFNAEARFLRAFAYYNLMDLYGNVPFVTEKDKVGAFSPKQIQRADLFKYVENELLALEKENLLPVKPAEYGRVGMASVHFLLARLYLNAKVYTGTERNSDCISYSSKVISDGYSLSKKYSNIFLADNDKNAEIIFALPQDGIQTQTYGGTTMLTNAAYGGSVPNGAWGAGSWGGFRTTEAFVKKFYADPKNPTATELLDERAKSTNSTAVDEMFWSKGQSLPVSSNKDFSDGWAVVKFKNVTSAGVVGKHNTFSDVDFPMFRLADAYLMYAEAVVNGGQGGSRATALKYVNDLRGRANAATISDSQLTPQFILDERGRELFWECTRRTDLIRFGLYTSAKYLWEFKGGIPAGVEVHEKFNIFPIPASDISANPNLTQNKWY